MSDKTWDRFYTVARPICVVFDTMLWCLGLVFLLILLGVL